MLLLAALLLSGSAYTFANPRAAAKISASRIEDRHLSGFNAVSVSNSADVYIKQGATESVKVEAPDDIIGHIITEVDGGVLKIHNKHDNDFHWGDLFGHHQRIIVYVTVKDVNSISVSGSGDVFFKEGITTNSLKLKVSGSGDLVGKIDVKALETGISGSGNVKLSGRADDSRISVSGSGDYSARGLITVNTAVHVSGSGDAEINASNKVDASVSGSGDIRYGGGAKNVSSSKSGSGEIGRF